MDSDESLAWAGAAAAAVTEWPCVDLVNSLYWRLSDRVAVLRADRAVVRVAEPRVLLRRQARVEFLRNYGDLVRWARREGLLADGEARHLVVEATRRPREAAAAHERAIALREALYAVFSAVAHQAPRPTAALDTLNAELARAAVPARLVLAGAGFRREWLDPRNELGWMLGPVVRSAAELLTSPVRERLKECPGGAGTACGEIFVDETKNRSRRWCSGATCGNHVRLYRHYTRVRANDPSCRISPAGWGMVRTGSEANWGAASLAALALALVLSRAGQRPALPVRGHWCTLTFPAGWSVSTLGRGLPEPGRAKQQGTPPGEAHLDLTMHVHRSSDGSTRRGAIRAHPPVHGQHTLDRRPGSSPRQASPASLDDPMPPA